MQMFARFFLSLWAAVCVCLPILAARPQSQPSTNKDSTSIWSFKENRRQYLDGIESKVDFSLEDDSREYEDEIWEREVFGQLPTALRARVTPSASTSTSWARYMKFCTYHQIMMIKFVSQGGGRGDGLGPPGPRLDRKESYKAQRKNYRFPMMVVGDGEDGNNDIDRFLCWFMINKSKYF